jgi:hypothetical protein
MYPVQSLAGSLARLAATIVDDGSPSTHNFELLILMAVVAYIPVYFVSRWCVRHYSVRAAVVVGLVAFAAVCTALFALRTLFGVAAILGGLMGLAHGVTDWLGSIRQRTAKNKQRLQEAAAQDSAWDEQALLARVREVYTAYQRDWTDGNLQNMQTYLEDQYYQHIQLMATALQQMGRRNELTDVSLQSVQLVDMVDAANNDYDQLSAYVVARATNRLIDIATGNVLYADTNTFHQLWWFVRRGNAWKLLRIDPAQGPTTNLVDVTLQRFAENHGMFYSLDWGGLLMPQRGHLFAADGFDISKIKNQVIGQWRGQIVQLYTYEPHRRGESNYVVAQLTLPKKYEGIIILRSMNKRSNPLTLRGYQRITLEWPDFNKRYTVYAANVDQAASLELLNPKFMADLYDQELPFNIEIVDNAVYLYAPMDDLPVSGSQKRYAAALDVLQAAYKELYR